ncbi:O-antigen ligase family protein [Ruegeria atlantica]|uniref:O-antigen ligase family protein n=1 Tax=Ruegeria atlantica TaxID=81569 RepID=UPI00147F12E9|nr:hypothetical protein [Ruegeria atlantica]
MSLNRAGLIGIIAFAGSTGLLPLAVGALLLLPALVVSFVKIFEGSLRFNTKSLTAFVAATLWIAMIWISSFTGGLTEYHSEDSFQSALRFTGSFVIFVMAYSMGQRDVPFLLFGFVVVSALHAAIAIGQSYLGLAANIHGQDRASGALTPNVLSNLLGFGLICWVALWVQLIPNSVGRRKLVVTGVLIAAGMVVAGTLKNIVVLAAILSAYYVLSSKREIVPRAILFVTVLILASPLIPMSERIVLRALDSFRTLFSYLGWVPSFSSTVEATDSLLWRYRHWELLISDWMQNHFLTGSGIGQARNMAGVRAFYNEDATAHSDWVAVMVEGGALFMPIWAGCVLIIYLCVFSAVKRVGERHLFILLLTYLYFIMIAGNVVYTIPFLYFLWALMGVLLVPQNLSKRVPFPSPDIHLRSQFQRGTE